jgi:hypothetical protein
MDEANPVTTRVVTASALTGGAVTDTQQIPAIDDDDWEDEVEEAQALRFDAARVKKARRLTGALALVAALGVGFAGGVYYQKHDGGSSPTTTGAAGFAALARSFGGGTGRTGGGGFAGLAAASGAVAGTVSAISGNTLYISEGTSSALVKVDTNSNSTISVPETGSVSNIHPGDTVVIRGAKQSDGSYLAGTITDSGTTTTGSTGAAG